MASRRERRSLPFPVLFGTRTRIRAGGWRWVAFGKAGDSAERGSVEIEQDLAGNSFHLLAGHVNRDLAAVGHDAEFGEGLFDALQFLAQGGHGAADLTRRNAALARA